MGFCKKIYTEIMTLPGTEKRWLITAIFFLFLKNFRGGCDSYESHPPLFWTIYFPTAPYLTHLRFFP